MAEMMKNRTTTGYGTDNGRRMGGLQWILGIAASLAGVVILLISSFEAAAYADYGFYEKEYEKYEVLADLDMEMDDVMYVTREMMDYLRGDRENLDVYTTVEGKEQDFFNEQDKLHMADVQRLFLGGLMLRRGAAAVLAVCLVLLFLLRSDVRKALCRGYQMSLIIIGAAVLFLAAAFVSDFNAAFTKFHEIFFTNDLWLFDPAEDYMIRMLPEGFFADMVIRIGLIFVTGLLALLVLSFVMLNKKKQKGRTVSLHQD